MDIEIGPNPYNFLITPYTHSALTATIAHLSYLNATILHLVDRLIISQHILLHNIYHCILVRLISHILFEVN
jgi:hypothetical protein